VSPARSARIPDLKASNEVGGWTAASAAGALGGSPLTGDGGRGDFAPSPTAGPAAERQPARGGISSGMTPSIVGRARSGRALGVGTRIGTGGIDGSERSRDS
jgi:hypothetical protein